jgi:hypothetical protein
MKNHALQYFMHDGPAAFRFELAGDLDSEGAHRVEQDWRTASSVIGDRALIIDLTFLTGAEEEGRALLAHWYRDGAQLIARSKPSRDLVESIIGEPLIEPVQAGGRGADWTWRTSFAASKLSRSVLFATLLVPLQLHAAHLKAETVAAWDSYVQTVRTNLQDRVRPGGSFLWTTEDPERVAKVHAGEIVVAPAPGQNPRKVPGGLIHHWIGAAFLPGAKLDDVTEVTRDYDRYEQFYRPSVVESRTVAHNDSDDLFSMLLMNKTFFLKTALDADYQVTNVRVDSCRFYSVSRSTRVQEIEDYRQPGEHKIPEGEGGGYIWKLFSIARLEQADGGVYVEMEAIALSREIPAMVSIVVDPIVRRVSRNSILLSIQQTEQAVRGNSLADMQRANSPSVAEHAGSAASLLNGKASAFVQVQ